MTLQQFVRDYLRTPAQHAQWNSWPIAKRKAHVKQWSKYVAKKAKAAKKTAKKAATAAPARGSSRIDRSSLTDDATWSDWFPKR